MSFRVASKLTIPVAFFGYAALANVTLWQADLAAPDISGLLKGGAGQSIDALYRDNLPHRDKAIGWIGAARYVLLNEGRDGVVGGKNGWLFTSEEFRAPSPQVDAVMAEAIDWIAEVDRTLAQQGSQLVVVPLASKADIERSKALTEDQPAALSRLYHSFLMNLDEAGISNINTRDALLGVPQVFFTTDTHWTAKGAANVAKSIAASGVIPSGDEIYEQQDQSPITFTGDLVSFVTSDGLAPFVGLPAETVTPYLAVSDDALGGELDLFGSDGPAPYALVGTSYSANENWSFVEALKLALDHDVLNHAQEGQGPIAPMRTYLQNGLDGDAPEYVIWEFPVRYLTDLALMEVADES